ncbi:MAG: peptidoglycan editing factor PgeF [Thermomicrobiales bacterium]|nr:peptidoglycan editing factor PgeF [Thermomicrobiales bacterium]
MLTSSLLHGHATIRHGVSGRLVGVEPAEGNVGYSKPRDIAAAWIERQRWAQAARIDPNALTTASQVHGNDVIAIGIESAGNCAPDASGPYARADALITASPGVAVMTLHADCLPIILADPELPAIGVVHAGWRSTVGDVVGETVRAMVTQLGADLDRIVAMVGPGMRSCCYEVGNEVVDAWRAIAGREAYAALAPGPGSKWHFDLPRANMILLERAGISADRIDDQAHCTMCHADRWFSHRAQGPETGRFAAFAGIAPVEKEDSSTWT